MIIPDFTPTVSVPATWHRRYTLLRVVLYLVFFCTAVFLFVRVVFPGEYGYFDFAVYRGGANTIADPRYEDGTPAEDALARAGRPLLFNFSAVGDFRDIAVTVDTEGEVDSGGTLSVTRSYRAALYPEGAPVHLRDGSLVRTDDGFFLISQGTARRFASVDILRAAGYVPEQFRTVTPAELVLSPRGDDITDAAAALPDALYIVAGTYYQLHDGGLVPFVSDRAYLSWWRPEDAVARDDAFVAAYPPADDTMTGFISGTLVSYGESAYVVEGATLRPVDNPVTFIAKGYDWNVVVPLTGEEFGIYQMGRLYTRRVPHPSGTVFADVADGSRTLIADGRRHAIVGDAIADQYRAVTLVAVDEVVEDADCRLEDTLLAQECVIRFDALRRGVGAEYQFTYVPAADATLTELETVFNRDRSAATFRVFLGTVREIFVKRFGIGL